MPYTHVSWTKEPITTDKLNAMAANDQWLFESAPTVYYNAYGNTVVKGLKFAAGLVYFGASKNDRQQKTISFGSYFSAGCRPIVTATYSSLTEVHLHVNVKSWEENFTIDNRGFNVHVYANNPVATKNYFPGPVYVHWLALGY